MANTLGRQQVVGFGKQSSRGTGVTAAYWFRRNGEFTPNENVEYVVDDSAIGNNSMSRGSDPARQWAEPTIPFFVDLASWGAIEFNNADSYAVAGNADASGNVYDHTSKVGTATSIADKLLSINVDDATRGDLDYDDAILNGYKLDFNMSTKLTGTLDFVSKYSASGSQTVALVTPNYFMGRHITVKIGTAVSTLAAFSCKSGSIEISNGVNNDESAFNLGTVDIADHHKTERTATITLNKFLADNTYMAYFKAGTELAVEITIEDTATTIGTAANPLIKYTFPVCTVQSVPSNGLSDIRGEDLTLTAHYGLDDDESASYLYKSFITNLVDIYSA